MLFEESVFIFQFLNNKMHNYVFFAIIVHFNIQKLKNKQTFIQTEKAKSSHFDRTRGDKNKIFRTKDTISYFLQIFLKINSNFDFPMKVSRNISTVLSQSLYALLGGVE